MSIGQNKIELDEIAFDKFEEAVKDILVAKPKERELLEKRMPTREELEKKWKLKKRW